jgi:hypothetical protein
MVWSNLTKNLASFANGVKKILISFLLQETGNYILTEDGYKIVLDRIDWNNQSKNMTTFSNSGKNTTSYGNNPKNTATYSNQTRN